ncbi:MAG: beta-ketoacyl-[acyl-carrier-protein] synthase II, partial [Fuerstia sp.]|nr:beta-ketoacyl-[acyl-carrier-protein] synthase II [Fuerstiella sp.]
MKRRVVVTGMGAVTPLGIGVESMWQAQKDCHNGVGPITHFDASHFPTRFAAEV